MKIDRLAPRRVNPHRFIFVPAEDVTVIRDDDKTRYAVLRQLPYPSGNVTDRRVHHLTV